MLTGLGAFCERALAEHGCPSISVAIAERGGVVLAEARGLADVAERRPATPGTAYGIGSITKPFTATAVCLAADEGLLDLDAPAPGSFRGPAPTARQLLSHRGGLGAHYDWDYGDGARLIDADLYTLLHREPGAGFEYANLGYRILGRLLEQASGQDLGAFIRDRVCAPLGLASFHLGRAYPGPAPAAARHTADGRAYPSYGCSHPGASLGWATAAEVALFAQSCQRLLAPRTAAAVLEAPPVNDHVGYGLGWAVSRGGGPLVLSHGGGGGGVAAMAAVFPERELSVAVLSNSTSKRARDAVLGHVLSALVPGYTPAWITPAVPDPARPLGAAAGGWAGRVATPDGDVPARLRVSVDGRAELRLDGAAAAAPAGASRRWDLRASFDAQLPTADARVNSPRLALWLRLEDGALAGVACAFKDGDRDGWLGNFLTHPCRFRRA